MSAAQVISRGEDRMREIMQVFSGQKKDEESPGVMDSLLC